MSGQRPPPLTAAQLQQKQQHQALGASAIATAVVCIPAFYPHCAAFLMPRRRRLPTTPTGHGNRHWQRLHLSGLPDAGGSAGCLTSAGGSPGGADCNPGAGHAWRCSCLGVCPGLLPALLFEQTAHDGSTLQGLLSHGVPAPCACAAPLPAGHCRLHHSGGWRCGGRRHSSGPGQGQPLCSSLCCGPGGDRHFRGHVCCCQCCQGGRIGACFAGLGPRCAEFGTAASAIYMPASPQMTSELTSSRCLLLCLQALAVAAGTAVAFAMAAKDAFPSC